MLIFQNSASQFDLRSSVIYLYFSLFSCGLKISESVETHYLEITAGNMQEIFRKALTLIQNILHFEQFSRRDDIKNQWQRHEEYRQILRLFVAKITATTTTS